PRGAYLALVGLAGDDPHPGAQGGVRDRRLVIGRHDQRVRGLEGDGVRAHRVAGQRGAAGELLEPLGGEVATARALVDEGEPPALERVDYRGVRVVRATEQPGVRGVRVGA